MRCRALFLLLVAVAAPLSRPDRAAGQAVALPATTVQLPTFGVAVDAAGVLSLKTFEDPTGRLHAEQVQAFRQKLAPNLLAHSPIRKVSLVRLEAALRRALADGKKPDDAMRYLAGLQRIQFVFFFPQSNDVVIAGPAEGFAPDPSGRVCGLTSGRPTLRLDDLAVALRAFPPGKRPTPFVGCTIDPTQEAMTRLQAFQKTVPRAVPEAARAETGDRIAAGMRTALGSAPIRVFGIPAESHFAQVLVEADYRMKLIGIGLEQPPVRLKSFFDLAGGGHQGILERWWFTPDYDCLCVSPDRLSMELVGDRVQLLSEAMKIAAEGQLSESKTPPAGNRASDQFARGFTQKFPDIAAKSPVYAELRNLIDMLVACAFMQQQNYADRAGWKMETFASEQALPVQTETAPREVPCAVNAAWRGGRFTAVAGGGVSINPDKALAPDRLLPDKDGKLAKARGEVDGAKQPPADRWWWD